MQRLLRSLVPFIMAGIALVALAYGIVLLAYLFFFGAIIGLVMFAFTWLRNKLFPPKTPSKPQKQQPGRIIDSDDWKKL